MDPENYVENSNNLNNIVSNTDWARGLMELIRKTLLRRAEAGMRRMLDNWYVGIYLIAM